MGLLSKIAGNPPVSKTTRTSSPQTPVPDGKGEVLKSKIARFQSISSGFHYSINCILFDKNDGVNLCERLSKIIDKAGTVIPSLSGNPLILLPGNIDLDLIAHRLSKTVNKMPLLSFQANSPEYVMKRIGNL